MKTCYIVGAGDFTRDFSPDRDDLVICADGGYDALLSRGIGCDLLVGDLDSVKSKPLGVEIIRHKVEKDETDMHLCYLEGRKRGYKNFVILGGTGGRDDHTFANYSLLYYIRKDGGRAELFSKLYKISLIISESYKIPYKRENEGKTVSVFAFSGDAYGVSVKGLYYECENATLSCAFPLGVSNHFIESDCEISVKEGALLIFEEL